MYAFLDKMKYCKFCWNDCDYFKVFFFFLVVLNRFMEEKKSFHNVLNCLMRNIERKNFYSLFIRNFLNVHIKTG